MNPLPDSQLISEIQHNLPSSSDNLVELIDRHSGIYLEIVNNYIPDNSIIIRKADLIEDKE